jgi:hypothetical protein
MPPRTWFYIVPYSFSLHPTAPIFFFPFVLLRLVGEAFLLLTRITELLSSATPFSISDSSALLRPRVYNSNYPPSSGPIFLLRPDHSVRCQSADLYLASAYIGDSPYTLSG